MNEYIQGSSLPDWGASWLDADGAVIDFSSGWTFVGHMVNTKTYEVEFAKTTGISGAATEPNITTQWDVDELDIPAADYTWYIFATNTGTSKTRISNFHVRIVDAGPAV